MKLTRIEALGLLASLTSTASALVTYSPGPSYSIGIPSSSTISSSTTGSLYFQLSASTSYQWVGLGIGSQMAGAKIFVMYTDGKGNVTLSARDGGVGQVQPSPDSTLQAGITLLEGSGVVNGKMIANVKCTSCQLDASSNSSPWIAAWSTGSAINSASVSYSIAQHAPNNHKQVQLDLTQASMSSDSNPFVSSSSGTTGTATGSSPTSTSSSSSSSGDDNGKSGDNSGSSGVKEVGTSITTIQNYDKAHGTVMGVTVVLLFPLGAIFMRLGSSAWMHGAWQLFSLIALLVGFGLGIKLKQLRSFALNTTHTIFGIVIVALFLLQPLFGIIHHIQYRRNQARAPVSHLHIWYGRILMAAAVVNGGLGLQLAKNTKNGEIAYGVVAGIMGLAYIILVVLKRKGGSRSSTMSKEAIEEHALNRLGSADERESQRRNPRRSEGRRDQWR